MNNAEKPIRSPFVVLREEFDDWAVLFDPDTGHGFGLNPTGVYIWKLLDGKHTISGLLEEIFRHAKEAPSGSTEHIEAFVDTLIAGRLAVFANKGRGLATNADLEGADACACSPHTFNYERPMLVCLNSERQVAYGMNCSPGSLGSPCQPGASAPGFCADGTSAGKHQLDDYCATGYNACPSILCNCGYGSSPTYECLSGNYANTSCSPTGTHVT